jgi:hypothetical protein
VSRIEGNGALLITNGRVTVTGLSQIGGLTVRGGTLANTGALSVTGALTLSSGSIDGAGRTAALGGILINGAFTLSDQQLNSSGRTLWTGAGSFLLADGAVFNNLPGALFEARGSAMIGVNGSGRFANAGTFRRLGAGTTTVRPAFDNSGAVEVQSGTLDLNGGGISSGTFSGAAGTTLVLGWKHTFSASSSVDFPNVSFTLGTATIDGAFRASESADISGTALFNSAATLAAVSLRGGGLIDGSGTLTIAGPLSWSGGSMRGAGKTVARGGIAISGGVGLSRVLENYGTAVWSGTGWISATGGALNNMPGALFEVRSDAVFANGAGSQAVFNNAGTFRKTAGAGATTLSGAFNNSGAVEVLTGTLVVGFGGTSGGSFTGAPGTTLTLGTPNSNANTITLGPGSSVDFPDVRFEAGATTIAGAYRADRSTIQGNTRVTFSGPGGSLGGLLRLPAGRAVISTAAPARLGALELAGGTLEGSAAVEVSGPIIWSAGFMEGTGRTVARGGIAMSGITGLRDRPLDSYAASTWASGGTFTLADAAVFTLKPGATFDVQGDSRVLNGVGSMRFVNAGTLRKSAGAGELSLGVRFENSGAVEIQSGTLKLAFGGDSSGSFTGAPGTSLSFEGQTHTLLAGSSVDVARLAVKYGVVNVEGALRVRETTVAQGNGRPTLNIRPGATLHALGETLSVEGGLVNLGAGPAVGVGSFTLASGGVLTGTRDLTVTQSLTWTGGTLGGAGRTVSNGTLAIDSSSGSRHDMAGRRLENNGAASWNGRYLHMYEGAVLQNNAAGTFDITGDGYFWWCDYTQRQDLSYVCERYGAQPQVINAGTLRKTGGAGELRFWYAPLWEEDIICANSANLDKATCAVGLTNSGVFEVRSGAVNLAGYVQTAGSLALAGGNVAQRWDKVLNLDGGVLTGSGTIDGSVRNAARIAVGGPSAGALTISGTYTQQAAGVLEIGLGGGEAGVTYDRLAVGKAAALGGALSLATLGGFAPAPGSGFAILTYASRSGGFASVSGGGRSYTVSAGATGLAVVAQ